MSNDTCSIAACGGPVEARGWCVKHYKRWRKHGDTETVLKPVRDWGPVEERFWTKAAAANSQGCRIWAHTGNPNGYGQFSFKGKMYLAHRFIYTLEVGPIPAGLLLDHTCHNEDMSCPGGITCKHRRCVTVSHLEPVTDAENSRRGRNSGPTHYNSLKTHCINGHPFAAENTRVYLGERSCRTCARDQARTYRQRKK